MHRPEVPALISRFWCPRFKGAGFLCIMQKFLSIPDLLVVYCSCISTLLADPQPIWYSGFQSTPKAKGFCSVDLESVALPASESWNSRTFQSPNVYVREGDDRGAGNPKYPKSLFSGMQSDSAAQLNVTCSQLIVIFNISCGNKLLFNLIL